MTKVERLNQYKCDRIGVIKENKDGIRAKCIEYDNSDNITVEFLDYNYVSKMRWDHFNDGKFNLPFDIVKSQRVGTKITNHNGFTAECIEYNNANDISIKVNTTIIPHVIWGNFINGKFKINQYGGYVGSLDKSDDIRKISKEYESWLSMLKRCYSQSVKNNRPTYDQCTVCDEWMNYDNFYNWIINQSNYTKWKNSPSKWCLDKDLLFKSNKLYSPETCVLVPNNINCLLLKCDKSRGKYPVGVYYDTTVDLYRAQCENPKYARQITIGYFEDPHTAFYAYKTYKEKLIKKIALEEYEAKNITEECYKALCNYEVEITD